jgi:hypothetical protein
MLTKLTNTVMTTNNPKDHFGLKKKEQPVKYVCIGGYFHGQVYSFADPDARHVKLLKPTAIPPMVDTDPSEEISVELRAQQESYTLMYWNGRAFLGCTTISDAELTKKLYEHINKTQQG